jgi:hypothetical protein
LFSLKRHGGWALKPLFPIIAIISRTVPSRTGLALLLVTRLKLTRLTRLIFTRLVFSWLLVALLRFSRLKVAVLARFTGLKLALLPGLGVLTVCRWLTRLILALFAGLKIPVVALRTWVARLKILFAWLILAGGLIFLSLIRRLAKASSVSLTLTRSSGAFALTVLVIAFWLIEASKTRIGNPELFLGRCNQAKIMLGMLEKAFRRHMVASCLGVTTQLHIFLGNILGRTADLNIWTVRLIRTCERIWTFAAAAAVIAPIATTHTLVLMIGSHRTSVLSKIIHGV